MVATRINRCLSFFLAGFLMFFAHAARADCDRPETVLDIGSCQARDFFFADSQLTQHYMQLHAQLTPIGRVELQTREQVWLHRRDVNCTSPRQSGVFINFSCVLGMTLKQDQILSHWFDNPSTLPSSMPYEGRPQFFVGLVPPPPPNIPFIPPAVQSHAAGHGTHGCAMFGVAAGTTCQNFPNWAAGTWTPPSSVTRFRVLTVGGGGGGAASGPQGMGGSGGGSGEVVVSSIIVDGSALRVLVGYGGATGTQFAQPAYNGGSSSFGTVQAAGGQGGQADMGGGQKQTAGGNNGGGGAGGGTYHNGYRAGAGGAGGKGGTDGESGMAAADPPNPVQGAPGGRGSPFPPFNFQKVTITLGTGGAGGQSTGTAGTGCGGGGGGGGGGVILNAIGTQAANGIYQAVGNWPCGGNRGYSGVGGMGFGAGGGGGGNFSIGTPGGSGNAGFVYVEW